MLAADAALGVFAALLVLAQAVLIAHVAAGAFDGARSMRRPCRSSSCSRSSPARPQRRGASRSSDGGPPPTCCRGFESRSSSDGSAISPPRSTAPRAPRSATTAVDGAAALETFARYIPQLVLAVVVPVAVLVLVAAIDLVSAGIMLLTLPLVPVFMWLIGRYTERKTEERRQALALLATHFLDVVRGLPTSGRSTAEPRRPSGSQRPVTATGGRR